METISTRVEMKEYSMLAISDLKIITAGYRFILLNENDVVDLKVRVKQTMEFCAFVTFGSLTYNPLLGNGKFGT